jgi:hypothetical protein
MNMPKQLRPAYVVEREDGSKELFRTKKEICEKYGMKLGYVNKALILYPLKVSESPVRITYFSCKHCEDYMLESKRCFKSKLCGWR